ncbi:MAG: hypothetical protein ACR2J4_08150 [Deinococcus sp.]
MKLAEWCGPPEALPYPVGAGPGPWHALHSPDMRTVPGVVCGGPVALLDERQAADMPADPRPCALVGGRP